MGERPAQHDGPVNSSPPPSWLALGLNLAGGVAVAYAMLRTAGTNPAWVLALGLVSVAAWMLRGPLARAGFTGPGAVLCIVAAVTGGLVAAPLNGLSVVPAAIAVMVVLGEPRIPVIAGAGLALLTVALIAVGAVPFGSAVPAVVAMMSGVVIAAFAGVSRRQFRVAEAQAALLRERELTMREESSRIALARDLHDVLAHSLGGLVIQLDAVGALLESGDTASAARRVEDARRLAADGLGEARRAVDALRAPGDTAAATSTVPPDQLAETVTDLVEAHRSLGGVVDVSETGRPHTLGPAQAVAVRRALQEALSNARKHAPGQPVRVDVAWQNDRVRLTVSNPLADDLPPSAPLRTSGGGHGLDGMRERFAALPGGSASAGVEGDRFTVRAEALLS